MPADAGSNVNLPTLVSALTPAKIYIHTWCYSVNPQLTFASCEVIKSQHIVYSTLFWFFSGSERTTRSLTISTRKAQYLGAILKYMYSCESWRVLFWVKHVHVHVLPTCTARYTFVVCTPVWVTSSRNNLFVGTTSTDWFDSSRKTDQARTWFTPQYIIIRPWLISIDWGQHKQLTRWFNDMPGIWMMYKTMETIITSWFQFEWKFRACCTLNQHGAVHTCICNDLTSCIQSANSPPYIYKACISLVLKSLCSNYSLFTLRKLRSPIMLKL